MILDDVKHHLFELKKTLRQIAHLTIWNNELKFV